MTEENDVLLNDALCAIMKLSREEKQEVVSMLKERFPYVLDERGQQ